ncbi:MAG: hypothetical protein R2704_10060 [Microthrixaceae bacterium]
MGRVIIYHNNEGGTAAFIMGANGRLQSVNPDGTTQDSDLHAEAFSEGDERTATVAPASTRCSTTKPTMATAPSTWCPGRADRTS